MFWFEIIRDTNGVATALHFINGEYFVALVLGAIIGLTFWVVVKEAFL